LMMPATDCKMTESAQEESMPGGLHSFQYAMWRFLIIFIMAQHHYAFCALKLE